MAVNVREQVAHLHLAKLHVHLRSGVHDLHVARIRGEAAPVEAEGRCDVAGPRLQ